MAYSTSNPPSLVTQGIAKTFSSTSGASTTSQQPRLWFYSSTDAATTVRVIGYITNARDLGMCVGDIVMAVDNDASPISVQYMVVSAINQTTGAGDLSDGTAITATNTD